MYTTQCSYAPGSALSVAINEGSNQNLDPSLTPLDSSAYMLEE